MISKKKCSSYGRELAVQHTTRSAVGLNACRWERRNEDTPAYDVVPPDAAGIVAHRKLHPDKTYGGVGKSKEDAIPLWDDDDPTTHVKRPPHPKPKTTGIRRNTELEFVWAPKKVQPKSKPKVKSKPIPSNLRSGLTSQQVKQLRAYSGSKRIKQRMEIYLKRGLSFSEAKKRAISRDKTEVVPVTKKKRGTGRGGKRFIFDEAGVG